MAWDETEFTKNASGPSGDVYRRYTVDNGWFQWGTNPKDEDQNRHISNAWKLYRAASQNTLNFLILGDDKIRKSPDLLMNFGCASGSGADKTEYELSMEEFCMLTKGMDAKAQNQWADKFVRKINDGGKIKMMLDPIKWAQENRTNVAKDAWGKLGRKLVDVAGPGSILNSDGWTPLLNDAYILAGVHGKQEFQWAAEGFDKEFGASKLRDWEKWKSYAVNHSVFWGDDGKAKGVVPRVFGREVIGLKTFGYIPAFTNLNIIFRWNGKPKVDPTFASYLDALGRVGFGDKDKASINKTLGEFLFGDEGALSAPQAARSAAP